MTITPNEISNKEFKKAFRGYDMDEVDIFLDALKEDYEKVWKLNSTLKEQVIVLKEKVEQYTAMESTLQNTLVLAQSAAQQAKENSEREANILTKEAEREASIILRNSEKKVEDINKEFDAIRNQFYQFKSRFKAMVAAQLETIEKIEIGEGVMAPAVYDKIPDSDIENVEELKDVDDELILEEKEDASEELDGVSEETKRISVKTGRRSKNEYKIGVDKEATKKYSKKDDKSKTKLKSKRITKAEDLLE